ncbi:hypothetical protein PMG11_09038 [Penicillium brasilianum]|uniref:Tat pathway signal sequence n=1 Tax=Penicillium brasilianum TaxID=104259 RepID=A0A0F7TYL6_PENBI|nr:hypothetical protein PMG11_09038 [Penicillium brasilianum]
MEPKQEDTKGDLGGSSTGLASPPLETRMLKMEENQAENKGIDNPRLQDSLQAVILQLQALATIMGRSHLAQNPSTNLYRLRKGVLRLINFQNPETRIVGLVGNTGVGKSSVINSILGGNSLARTNDDIDACTCVIVEYHGVDEKHRQPYTVEVDYMDRKEMREYLEHHLRSYRQWYFELERPKMTRIKDEDWIPADDADDLNGSEDGDEVKLTSNEIVNLQKAQQSTQEAFKALFKGSDEPTLKDLVRDDSHEAESEILDTLMAKAIRGLANRPGGEEAILYTEASDGVQECRELLDLLTTDSRGDTPAVWPFIKLIRVYLDAPILQNGLVLADMPGLRDLNYARQEATERYIKKQCHVLGFVTRISRCLTDETIEEINWKTWTELPAIVIATRADEVGGTGSDRGDPIIDQVLRDLDVRIKQVKDEAARACSSMRKAQGFEKGDLAEKWDDLKKEEGNLEFLKKKAQVDYRNSKTTTGMAVMPSRKDMKVFCVGNNDYLTNCNGDSEQEQAYVELSGIPQLRAYCQSIPAEAQMRQLATFFRLNVPSAIASVTLWASGAFDGEQKAKATDISELLGKVEVDLVSHFKSNHGGLVGSTRAELQRLFERRIGGVIDAFRSEWEARCTELCSEWVQWPCGSFAAACRKHGVHSTQTYGDCNWNVQLIEPTCEKVNDAWDEFMHCLKQQQDGIAKEITEKIQQICAPLQRDPGLTHSSRTGLLKSMQFREAMIIDVFHRTFEEAFREAKIVKDNMINFKKNRTAIITKYMLSAYQFANSQRGKGCDSRRKRHMEDHIKPGSSNNSGVIGNYKVLSQNSWSHALKSHFKRLKQKVAEVVDQQVLDLQGVAAEQGKMPEAFGDTKTAGEVMEQLKVIEGTLNHAQESLREIASNRK